MTSRAAGRPAAHSSPLKGEPAMNAVSAAEPLVSITGLHKGYGPAIQVLKGLDI